MRYDMLSIEIDGFEFGLAMVPTGERERHNCNALTSEDCTCCPLVEDLEGDGRDGVALVHRSLDG